MYFHVQLMRCYSEQDGLLLQPNAVAARTKTSSGLGLAAIMLRFQVLSNARLCVTQMLMGHQNAMSGQKVENEQAWSFQG